MVVLSFFWSVWHKDLMKPYKRESGNLILINFSNSRVLKLCMLKLALFQILQLFEGWVYHVVIVQKSKFCEIRIKQTASKRRTCEQTMIYQRPCELFSSLGVHLSLHRKLSHLNLFFWNHWTILNLTWLGWSFIKI
jgi:hypothetical protein